ncbi:DUF1156 domain-containing protein [Sulfolobus sp. E11-6]|uniref:DUF1156 domain-containing protein n=1 Tax=Sulfolobus sp. E11-6 TaxID=2663020 RepID=UPI001EECE1CC|nr:DUF1156 domain-containing protein [Sulfolobus sp. E11-6]
MQETLLESDEFLELVPLIDEKASQEKGPARPAYWDMIFWWTRKPLIASRAYVAASILPKTFDTQSFKDKVRLYNDKTYISHKVNPTKFSEFKNVTLLDPFAGFGSIPLEALRLGVGKVVASDLLPTAVFFMKAILEYPKNYGRKLLEDVKKYGEKLLQEVEKYSKELYPYDGYIGTWEVKCPACNKYTPLLNQFWLLRLKGGEEEEEEESVRGLGSFKRLVYMDIHKENDKIRIVPRDLNKELGKSEIKARVDNIPTGNIKPRSSYARCLYCGNVIPGKGENWYVREAMQEWNKNFERF